MTLPLRGHLANSSGSPHIGNMMHPPMPPSCIMEELQRAFASKNRQERWVLRLTNNIWSCYQLLSVTGTGKNKCWFVSGVLAVVTIMYFADNSYIPENTTICLHFPQWIKDKVYPPKPTRSTNSNTCFSFLKSLEWIQLNGGFNHCTTISLQHITTSHTTRAI